MDLRRRRSLVGLLAAAGVLGLAGGGATPGSAQPDGANVCLARNGVVLLQKGTATCEAGPQSFAQAIGAGSVANAPGTNNTVTARGDGVRAEVGGTNNAVAVSGPDDDTFAFVAGDGNTVTVSADKTSSAFANFSVGGDGNTLTAIAKHGSIATAELTVNGDDNTVTAKADHGSHASAAAQNGSGNTAIATTTGSGSDAVAVAGEGDLNTAVNTVDDGTFHLVEAFGGNQQTCELNGAPVACP